VPFGAHVDRGHTIDRLHFRREDVDDLFVDERQLIDLADRGQRQLLGDAHLLGHSRALANGALRKGEDVEKNATALAAAYKSVAPFWMAKNSDVAAKSLHEGIQGAEAAAAAADEAL